MTKISKQFTLLEQIKSGEPLPPIILQKVQIQYEDTRRRMSSAIHDPNSIYYKTSPGSYDWFHKDSNNYTTKNDIPRKPKDDKENPTKRLKSDQNTSQKTGILKLNGSPKEIPKFDGLMIYHPKLKRLSKVCPFNVIMDRSCKYNEKCNNVHLRSSADIRDKKQRIKFIDYVLKHENLSFAKESDAIKPTGV